MATPPPKPPPFYHPGRPEPLSQGDILNEIPYGLITDPLVVCRAGKPLPDGTQHGTFGPAEKITAGGAPFNKGKAEAIHMKASSGLVMVLWEDCEIDRFAEQGKPENKWFAAVAPIIPAAQYFVANDLVAVEAGRRRRFFPLPEDKAAGIDRPSYVDLRLIWSLQHSLLVGRRVTSLSDGARMVLRDQLFAFFTKHWLPDTIPCPACEADVHVRPKLIVAADD